MANKLQLLRNEIPFESYELALRNIATISEDRVDGEMWLTSYNDENSEEKTIVAVKRNGVTIFDNDGNTKKIETLITEKIEELDVPYGIETTIQYVFNVAETNGKIEKRIGVISPQRESPLTIEVGDSDLDKIFDINIDGTTIQKESFGRDPIQYQLKVGTIPASSVNVDRDTTLDDKLTEIDNSIGSISEEIEGNLKSYKVVEVSSPASTSQAEYKIQEKVGDGNWGDVDGSSTIVVPKDNAFVTAQLGHVGATADASTGDITDGSGEDALLIEYKNGSGVYTLVAIPVGDFLRESEFKNGLDVNANGEVSVKIDTTSTGAESFITVGEDGVKISGVQNAIETAITDALGQDGEIAEAIETAITDVITDLDATVGSQTVESGKHIAVEVVEEDGLLTAVTVTEDDIASASRLEEVERVTAEALNDLEMRKITLEDLSNFVTNVNGGNGISVSENGQSKTVSVDLDTDSTNALSFNGGKLYCPNNLSINCGTY